ncbi:extracellular solute-binding protein [Thalassotalea sp. SU-HH00458]|uniref:extracellular solute-binding protein n=1 Tax=Thalassotalea sp. SU-HH00458 TaxID=3127657 RepID=UPI0033656659
MIHIINVRPLISLLLFSVLFLKTFLVYAMSEQQVINFAVLANTKIKEQIYRDRARDFEIIHPNIKVRLIRLHSKNYPDLLAELLAIRDEVDVINWFASNRLKTLVDNGFVVDINDYWQENYLDFQFKHASKEQVLFNNKVYGIPLTSYIWGFYYKISLFKRLGIKPPKTWPEFIHLLDTLEQNQIAPIALGTKYPWQIAGWFDYLMLRLHGAEKYKQLVKGELAYTSDEVVLVFNYWKNLLNKKYFFAQHRFFDGDELMPLIYREVVGINLIGSFSLSSLPIKNQTDIGFFPFPTITDKNENSVLAPMSVIALTNNGAKKSHLIPFLQFFNTNETQVFINERLSTFSPKQSARIDGRPIIKKTAEIFEAAHYHSQYFDLEFEFEMAEYAKKAFSDFINHQDVDKISTLLEQKRRAHYSIKDK